MRNRAGVDVSHKSTAYIEGPSNFSTHSRSGEVLPPQQGIGSGRRKRGRKDVSDSNLLPQCLWMLPSLYI